MFLLIFLLCVWPYSCQDVISVEEEPIGNFKILKDLEDCKEANRIQENSIRDFQEKWSHKEGLLCPATINVNTQNRRDLQEFQNIRSMEECSIKCLETPTCNFWSWHHKDAGKWAFDCVLMSGFRNTHLDYNVISGAKNCPRAPLEPIEVTVHGKSNLTESQTSNFSCSARGGRPPFEISLNEVSQEVMSRDTINITAKENVKQIILICSVKDIYGFTSQAIKVIPILVGPNPSLIYLLHKSQSRIVEAGSVQDYECLTGGATPAPNIYWKILDQTGQELVANEISKGETENGGYSKIQVFMKENWTNLTITCIVSNDVGFESKSLHVPIIPQGQKISSSILWCPPLREVEHATANQLEGKGLNPGTVIRYECEPGYERSGIPTLLCQSNGAWSSSVPTCTKMRCYSFPNIENGIIDNQDRPHYYEDPATVRCNKGFRLVGSNITCGEAQEFVDVPTCQDVNECGNFHCDFSTTDCINVPGSYYCKCKPGMEPNFQCPRVDLGLENGGIPEKDIQVSGSETNYTKDMIRLNSVLGWCGTSNHTGLITPSYLKLGNFVIIDLKVPTIIRGFRVQGVQRLDGRLAYPIAVRLLHADDIKDKFTELTNVDGSQIEFRVLDGAQQSIMNLPTPIETRFVRLNIIDFEGFPCMRMELMGCPLTSCTHNS